MGAFCSLMSEESVKPTHRVHIYMSRVQIRAIDAWRGVKEGIPSRAEAIRRLLAIALKAEAGKC